MFGVNVTHVIGHTTNCKKFDKSGFCLESTNNSVYISGIRYNRLYGIIICAVKDLRKQHIPYVMGVPYARKPKASKILIKHNKLGMTNYIAFVAACCLTGIAGVYFYISKRKKHAFDLEKLDSKREVSYFDIAERIGDIWEIERHNLIIYNEVELGSGAFGTVFLGKLLGRFPSREDATSQLRANLVKAADHQYRIFGLEFFQSRKAADLLKKSSDLCDFISKVGVAQVAVKMLPDLANSLFRGEFLREIGLMKTLGYHERLLIS
ncbi:unnamed protein product [Strongylus vulgaris]|uniref:Protein kinase domain-containing protein n=1 Tax=Strongylus vulgaris TaxID=40348 RepID=A0A3P7HXH5_STRVU|nr:unnamed protein product [Strongylus vulgaris]